MIFDFLGSNSTLVEASSKKTFWTDAEKKALLNNLQSYFDSPLKLPFRDNIYIEKISAQLSYYLSMIFTEVEVSCSGAKAFLKDSIKVAETSLDILPPDNLNLNFWATLTKNSDGNKFYNIAWELNKNKANKIYTHKNVLIGMDAWTSASLLIYYSHLNPSKPLLQIPFNELPARLFDDKDITGINSVIEDSIEAPIFEKLNSTQFIDPIYEKIIEYLDEFFLDMIDE